MPNPNKRLHINFNLLLDEDTDQMLIQLAQQLVLPKSAVVRAAIRRTHAMKFSHTPLCADGQDCRAPHVHIYSPAPPVQSSLGVASPPPQP